MPKVTRNTYQGKNTRIRRLKKSGHKIKSVTQITRTKGRNKSSKWVIDYR